MSTVASTFFGLNVFIQAGAAVQNCFKQATNHSIEFAFYDYNWSWKRCDFLSSLTVRSYFFRSAGISGSCSIPREMDWRTWSSGFAIISL